MEEPVPEYVVAALDAALAGLECGRTDRERDEAFERVWDVLTRLGRGRPAERETATMTQIAQFLREADSAGG